MAKYPLHWFEAIYEEVSKREIILPLHPRMDREDVKWITKKVKEVVEQRSRDGRSY